MKIAMYGMPCAGKSTIMSGINNARVINGSQELNRISGGFFSSMHEEEKKAIRIEYTDYIRQLDDEMVISDGHYSFLENVAFTESDGDIYDVFLYIYCRPETLLERYKVSDKNGRFANHSVATLEQWQQFEISQLREECHKRNKDFYVVSDNESEAPHVFGFLEFIRSGHSSFGFANEICQSIRAIYPSPCELYIVDGDRTAIEQDSFRFCCNGKTSVFDGNFYTGYQSFLFSREQHLPTEDDYARISDLCRNDQVWAMVGSANYVVLSSGIKELWQRIGYYHSINNVIADPMISADTKYFVVKLLQQYGYTVRAIGDSKIDLYMLRQADVGTLYIGNRISRSLAGESLRGINLIYNHHLCKLTDTANSEVSQDIAICKSNSGINGRKLAAAHIRLGMKLGQKMSELIPQTDTAILVLERGGRFFGDGLYTSFGGTFYAINPKRDGIPDIDADRIVIVDSVINTGKSIMKIIENLRYKNPGVDIIIATNVIQEDAINLFEGLKVFAVRASSNSFVGRNQAKQIGKTGPDTADRLFNMIEKRF